MFQENPYLPIQTIAQSILKLSDFYIKNPDGETPWNEEYCQIAYRNYYLPLNFQRCSQIISRGLQVHFFEGLTHFIDWGAGPATASLALAKHSDLKNKILKQILVDRSPTPFKVFSDLHSALIKGETSTSLNLKTYTDQKHRTCLVFSYSLTEIEALPTGWDQFEALMILEPATNQDGRKLLELRKKLIEAGFLIWAPCVHQLSCPLLELSKNDWCHDRHIVEAPDWFWDLEQKLPIKNKSITTSYLLARKKKPATFANNIARLTGDSREEKGKTRQLICRNEKREFLTWMHKQIEPQIFPRGELVQIPEAIEEKSNELRLQEKCNLL